MAANQGKMPGTTAGRGSSRNGSSPKTALELYRTMLRIRRVQEALIEEYHPADEMRCPIHFCVGQEATATGVCLNLHQEDYAFTGHRSHGYFLAKGGSLTGLIAELYGKSTGNNGGKAGHQEISDEAVNFYSGTILVGTLPIAAGAAFASQMRGEGRVALAVFGDGGADEGVVYETLNFAAVKKLPMVFICENNRYSTYSRQDTRQSPCDISGRARAFGVPSRRMYGNDVQAVYRAAKRAITRARDGEGPSLLELETYRWCGHVGPENDDHFKYRSMDELQSWINRCPIEGLKGSLLAKGILDQTLIEDIEREIKLEIQQAFAFAKSSPFPDAAELSTNIFSNRVSATSIPVLEPLEAPFNFRQPEAVPRPY